MDETQLVRLEALRLALQITNDETQLLALAGKFETFLLGTTEAAS